MKKCKICEECKDDNEMVFFRRQEYICKDFDSKSHIKEDDDYLEFMYSTNGFDK